MCRTSSYWLAKLAVAGVVATLWTGNVWSQLPEIPQSAAELKDKTQPAADAVKQAAPKAGSSAKDAADDLRDAGKSAASEAREGAKRVGDAAKGAADDTRRGAEDAVKGARREGREAVREGREAVREGAREGREVSAENLRAADLGLWFDSSASGEGLVIADIAAQGAISKIGFQEGDRIVSINGTPVRAEADFTRLLLADDLRNERVKIIVFRGGREQILYVQPSVIYQEVVAYDPFWQYGLVIDDRFDDRIVIQRVYPRTPAYYAGLRAGDVITSLGGRPITTVVDFTRALSSADGRLALEVNRANRTRQIALDTSTVTEGRARASLRPNIDAEGRVEGRTEGRLEGRTEGRAKGRLETDPTKEDDAVPTPRPRLDRPKSDKPGTDTPRSEKPGTVTPRSEKPGTDTPRSEKPGTDTPRAEKPDVEIPDVPAPAPKGPAAGKGPAAPKAPNAPKAPGLPKL